MVRLIASALFVVVAVVVAVMAGIFAFQGRPRVK